MYFTTNNTLILMVLLTVFCGGRIEAQLAPETLWGAPVDPTNILIPGYLETTSDVTNAMDYTKIGDVTVFSDFAGFPVSASATRHQYAKIQAWNADMTLLHFGTIFFLKGDSYTLYKKNTWAGLNDGRWSNIDPNIFYFCTGNDFKKLNVITDQVTMVKNLPAYTNMSIGPWEGNLSADDKYVVLTEYNANGEGVTASVYDIENDMILGAFAGNFDWTSMTPSGDYVVVSNNVTGQIERYDRDFQNMVVVRTGQQHGDFAVDVNGDEVWVQVIPVSMTRISDGVTTDLLPATASTSGTCGYNYYNPNVAGHISGRNFDWPGWALVSASVHPCSNDLGYDWRTEVFAVKLDYTGEGTIRSFGYSRSSSIYGSLATISPDGEKVLFMSDWGTHNGAGEPDILTYLAEYNPLLPVTWAAPLMVENDNEKALLSWAVTEQKENEKFVIEHSTDGLVFETIGAIKGEGNTSISEKYHFIHPKPAAGDNYYRIKQVDYTGYFSYTNIVQLFFKTKNITIYPMPANDEIIIHSAIDNSFSLYNHLGVKLKEGKLIAGDNVWTISDLSAGVYFVKTKFGESQKLIIY